MKKIICVLSAALAVLLIFAACSKDGQETPKTVSTDGSTSMEEVVGALGESFTKNNDGTKFTYNPTGSSSGITAVLEGRCDIGLSSRALKDEEKAKGLKETTIALDGIAIIVNPSNAVSDLTVEQIAKIYTGEITNWKELGGKDSEIVLIGREAGSGTRDGFESATGTKDKCKYRQQLTSTGDVIATVAQNPQRHRLRFSRRRKGHRKGAQGKRSCSERGHRQGRQLQNSASVRLRYQGRHRALSDGSKVFRLHNLQGGRGDNLQDRRSTRSVKSYR